MIQGDIDLTEQLDFYRDKPKKREKGTYIVPWKGRDQKALVTTRNGRSYDSWVYHNAFTFNLNSTITTTNSSYITYTTDHLDNLMYYYYTNNITWNSNINTTVNLIPATSSDNLVEDENIIDSGNSSDIVIEDTSDNNIVMNNYTTWDNYSDPYTVTLESINPEPVDPIKTRFCRGKKHKEKVVGEQCSFCGKRTIVHCECYKTDLYNNQYEMRKRFTTKKVRNSKMYDEHRQNALKYRFSEKIRVLLFGPHAITKKNERYLDPKHTMENKHRRIPWLDKLLGRVYEDYMKDLYEEQDYTSFLTNMSWLRMHETILIDDNTDTITIS